MRVEWIQPKTYIIPTKTDETGTAFNYSASEFSEYPDSIKDELKRLENDKYIVESLTEKIQESINRFLLSHQDKKIIDIKPMFSSIVGNETAYTLREALIIYE